jgi:hypothetical protein
MKILIKKPELKISSNDCGVWLHFKTKTGLSASLNLPLTKDRQTIVGKALFEWSKEYAEKVPSEGKGWK